MLQLTLVESGDALSGTWTMRRGDGSQMDSGTLEGRAFGSTMTIVLSWSPPTSCPLTLSVTLDATGTQMTGGVSSVVCGGYFSNGSFSAIKR
jgi:hypothetical protein